MKITKDHPAIRCEDCDGTGQVEWIWPGPYRHDAREPIWRTSVCSVCEGRGYSDVEVECWVCGEEWLPLEVGGWDCGAWLVCNDCGPTTRVERVCSACESEGKPARMGVDYWVGADAIEGEPQTTSHGICERHLEQIERDCLAREGTA